VLLVRLLLEPSSAQSPFARSRCYLSRRGLAHHVGGRYPPSSLPQRLMRQSSTLSPPRFHPCTGGLCRLLSAGKRTFPSLALRVFPCVPGPLPRRLLWCTCPFLPQDNDLPDIGTRSAPRYNPYGNFSMDSISGLQSFTNVQPAALLATQVAPTVPTHRAAVTSTSEPLTVRYLPCPNMLTVHFGQLTGRRTFTSQDSQPCRLLPQL